MHQSRPASAATDTAEFLTDLDGGFFEVVVSKALSEVAAAVIDNGKKGKVTITFDMERIQGTHQVRLAHACKLMRPTSMGKASEETAGATVLFVGQYGRMSLAQPRLPGMDAPQQREISG